MTSSGESSPVVSGTTVEAFAVSRRLFAAALGFVFSIAFGSLLVQLPGLIGKNGIAPAAEFLAAVRNALGGGGSWEVPTLFWANSSDAALTTACWIGIAASVAMGWGFAPGAMSLLCWVLYLSLCSVGSPFLNFQWDALLLETALIAAVALPWRWRPKWTTETLIQRVGRWLLWWLVFRLMFESGVVKLTWGDKVWLENRALDYHFETQPIPHALAWYAHQLPVWILRVAGGIMYAIELVAPFLIVAPRRVRHAGAVALILLQAGILATGNFAYFNWLSIVICIPLLADRFWPERLRKRIEGDQPRVKPGSIPSDAALIAAVFIGGFGLIATVPGLLGAFRINAGEPIERMPAPLRSFNGYGLFRVMTTERPEIIVEGSRDGVNWQAYEFPWKPGDPYRRPGFVAPHQPRLDWQMWFAALGDVRQNPWFVNFLFRLLQGKPEVLALLEKNPFPTEPPKYVRAVLYDYHFTRWSDHTAAWWKRERKGLYCPPLSLRDAEQ